MSGGVVLLQEVGQFVVKRLTICRAKIAITRGGHWLFYRGKGKEGTFLKPFMRFESLRDEFAIEPGRIINKINLKI